MGVDLEWSVDSWENETGVVLEEWGHACEVHRRILIAEKNGNNLNFTCRELDG